MTQKPLSRRDVLQGLLLSLGGLAACGEGMPSGKIKATQAASGDALRFYTESEMSLLTQIADALIPATETPGAVAVQVPGYLDAMMADWASTKTQATHREWIAAIGRELNSIAGSDFVRLDQDSQVSAVAALDEAAFGERAQELANYRELKQMITDIYYVSEPGAVQELGWVPVPGRWDGCAPLEESGHVAVR